MEEKEKNKNKRFIVLIVLLLISAVFAGTSTYAWFTINRIVSVESLNVHIQASGGIELSTDGIDWKAVITQDDIINAHETYHSSVNQVPSSLEPVSTGGDVDNGFLKMYYGVTNNTDADRFALSATRTIEEEGSGDESDGLFLAFDIFFKADSAHDLYLTPNSEIIFSGENDNPGLENSIRFAFLNEGSVAANSEISKIQSLKGANASDVYIWEPNSDSHSETGILNANQLFGLELNSSNNNSISYDGITSPISIMDNVFLDIADANHFPNYFKRVDVDYKTKTGFSNNVQVFYIPAGITKFRIYIWVEGQDVDCENGSSNGDLTISFQLTTNMS